MNGPLVDLSERRGMDKQKALESALAQIERSFGKGSIMRLGSTPALDIEAISTGSIGLDIALGIGGLPKGRIIEIYGPESSGKTTLALHVIAEEQAQRRGLRLRRRRARARPGLRQEARGQHRRAPDLPARHRRAGARDHRDPGALRRGLGRRRQLGGGADPEGRARGRDGRRPGRRPGPADEPGDAQAHRARSAARTAW